MQCVMCQPRESSRWLPTRPASWSQELEGEVVKDTLGLQSRASNTNRFRVGNPQPPSFWSNLKTFFLPHVKEMILAGGEPVS